jgi:hypothetical protein
MPRLPAASWHDEEKQTVIPASAQQSRGIQMVLNGGAGCHACLRQAGMTAEIRAASWHDGGNKSGKLALGGKTKRQAVMTRKNKAASWHDGRNQSGNLASNPRATCGDPSRCCGVIGSANRL